MKAIVVKEKAVYMGRLPYEGDLLEELTKFVVDKGIRGGQIQVIGAVKKTVVGFYDQEKRQYFTIKIDKPMEILSLIGNISIKDGSPFIHAHITLADENGKSWGGHLMAGTVVFAGEFIIRELEGDDLVRAYDEETGLTLWDMK